MFQSVRSCCVTTLLSLTLFSAAGSAAVVTYTTLASYAAATTSTTNIGFNGILPTGTTFENFSTLTVGAATFTTPTAGSAVNVTEANYYSPTDYPAAFVTNGYDGAAGYTLDVTLSSPVYALALDYGQISSTGTPGTGSLSFSNGFTYTPSSIAGIGSTQFLGIVSTTPISSFSYTVTGTSYVVQDLLLSTTAPEPLSCALLLGGLLVLLPFRKRS